MPKRKVTTTGLVEMKHRGERIAMITAYDATFARLFDSAGADVLLVGDSLGMVVQGHKNTLPVTMDDIIYHCRAVDRGRERALLVGDMPFLSFQVTPEDAVRNAGRLLAEGGAEAVKIEGGAAIAPTARRLVEAGIPVMGHVGLTPQSVHALGGFKVQGKSESERARILEDALALQEAGCFAVVLELVPGELAQQITAALQIPTIGIGAGPECDGQVLVGYDLLGLNLGFRPKFLKTYAELGHTTREAVASYVDEVRAGLFPGAEHTFEAGPSNEGVRLYGAATDVPPVVPLAVAVNGR